MKKFAALALVAGALANAHPGITGTPILDAYELDGTHLWAGELIMLTTFRLVFIGGLTLLAILLLSGCAGTGGSYSTTVYRGYYDPYPGWGYRPIYIDRRHDRPHSRPPGYRPPPGQRPPPGHRPPGIGRPPGGRPPGGRPPGASRPPRPTQLPAGRAR